MPLTAVFVMNKNTAATDMGVIYAIRRFPRTLSAALTISSRLRARIHSEMTESTKNTPYKRLSIQIVTRMTDNIGMVIAMAGRSPTRRWRGYQQGNVHMAAGRTQVGGSYRPNTVTREAMRGAEGGPTLASEHLDNADGAAQAILRQPED